MQHRRLCAAEAKISTNADRHGQLFPADKSAEATNGCLAHLPYTETQQHVSPVARLQLLGVCNSRLAFVSHLTSTKENCQKEVLLGTWEQHASQELKQVSQLTNASRMIDKEAGRAVA